MKEVDRHGLLSLLYDKIPFWVETGLAEEVTVTIRKRGEDEKAWHWQKEEK